MKQLKKHFYGKGEVKGYEYTQIRGTEFAYLYEVTSNGTKHYEVFKKRLNSRFDCVSYPNSNSFGVWAWTHKDLTRAFEKFKEINIINP